MIAMKDEERRPSDAGLASSILDTEPAHLLQPVPDYDEHALDLDVPSDPTAQAGRRNARSKMAAGWRGIKSAVRGDSSFFAHFYRGTLIVITAALLGIDQRGWCLIVIGATLVLIAELAHSAVDTLARAIGDPEEPRLKTAREIAAGGVLVAAVGSVPSP